MQVSVIRQTGSTFLPGGGDGDGGGEGGCGEGGGDGGKLPAQSTRVHGNTNMAVSVVLRAPFTQH